MGKRLGVGHVLLPREALHLLRERAGGLLELGLAGHLVEAALITGDVLPQRGQRRLGPAIDEQRADVVEKLIAHRAVHGPVAQSLARLEDLLDPHVLDARLAQAGEVLLGIGQTVGMIDSQPVDHPVAHQREHEPVGLLEYAVILLAHPGEIIDVKEAAVGARLGVDVEETPAQVRIGPEAVVVVSGHVVWHQVEHQAQAGSVRSLRQCPELALAAELLGDAGGVDHVVSVGRARARLQRRRQVQVRDAEVPQVGDQRARVGEAEVGSQLKAIRRPESDPARPAQSTPLRIVIECAVTLICACAS